jgi:hypothetical protein
MYSWKRFSSILGAVFSVWWLFLLLCRSVLVSCSSICQSFVLIAELIGVLFRKLSPILNVPVFSMFFSEFQNFRSYIKVFDSLLSVLIALPALWIIFLLWSQVPPAITHLAVTPLVKKEQLFIRTILDLQTSWEYSLEITIMLKFFFLTLCVCHK